MRSVRAAFAILGLASLALPACSSGLLGGGEPRQQVQAYGACVARDDANWAKMDAYLGANKQKPGVTVTESGLQYRVLASAPESAPKPELTSTVQVRYRGTLIDGTLFDETAAGDPPAEFPANGVIKGWQEALTKMRQGEKWEVVIPSELAYGCKGAGSIPPDQVLVFEIELLAVK